MEEDAIFNSVPTSHVEYSIKHAARSWGVDIEFLISTHLKSIFKEESRIKKILTSRQESIGFFAGLSIFATSIVASIFATSKFTNKALFVVMNELTKMNNDIGKKVDFIASYIAGGSWSKFLSYNNLFIITMLGVSVFLGIMVGMS